MIGLLFRFFKVTVIHNYVKVLIFFTALFLYSATGYMYFELAANPDLSWPDACWWSIVTMTTVGYGDLFPVSAPGRFLVGFPTMLLGIGILGYGLSVVATFMIENKMKEEKGMKRILNGGHICICHFANLEKTLKLIHELRRDESTKQSEIVLIDKDLETLPAELQGENIRFVKGDPARESTLEQANLAEAAAAIIQSLPGDPEYSDNLNLRICLTIETMHRDVLTVVECMIPENVPYFERADCDSVICIASMTGQLLVQELQDPGLGAILSELTSNQQGKQFYVVPVPATLSTYQGLKEHFEGQEGVALGVRRKEENHLLPQGDFALEPDDQAILIAPGRPE